MFFLHYTKASSPSKRLIAEHKLSLKCISGIILLVLSVSTEATIENHTYNQSEALKSYQRWPLEKPDDLSMISAGFYFTPGDNDHKDLAQCPVCKTAISNWSSEANPITEHMRENELCGLAQAIHNKRYDPWGNSDFSYRFCPDLKPHVVVTDSHGSDRKLHYKFGCVKEHVDASTVMVSFDDCGYPYASIRQWRREQVKMADLFFHDLGFNDEHHFLQIVNEISCLFNDKRIKQYLIHSAFDLKKKQHPGYPYKINIANLYIQLLTTQNLTNPTCTQAYKDQERVRKWGVTCEDILHKDMPPSEAITHIIMGKTHDVMGQHNLDIISEIIDELSMFFIGLQPKHILNAARRRLEMVNHLPNRPTEPLLPIAAELFFILAFDSEISKEVNTTNLYKTIRQSLVPISEDTYDWLGQITSVRLDLLADVFYELNVKGQINFLISQPVPRKEDPDTYLHAVSVPQYYERSASGYSVHPPEYYDHKVNPPHLPPTIPSPEQHCSDPQHVLHKIPEEFSTNYAVINKMDKKSSEAELFLVQSKHSGQHYVLKKIKLKNPEQGSLLHKYLLEIFTAQKNKEMAGFNFITKIRRVFYPREQDIEYLYLLEAYYPQSLAERLKEPTPLIWSQRQTILIGVAEAIEALHSCGFIHRDIKADNIMLDDSGNPLLTDLASLTNILYELKNQNYDPGKGLNVCEDIRGTITNAAPEVIPDEAGRQPYGQAADIWSFAVVCWFTFGGQETLFQAKWVPIEIRNRKENICYYYHEGLNNVFPKHFSPWQQHCKLVRIKEDMPSYILKICTASFNRDPKKRPTIGTIILQLENPNQEVIAIPKS